MVLEGHRTLAHVQEPENGLHGGRLAGAVGTDDDDDFAFVDANIDAVEDVHPAVAAVEVEGMEKAHSVVTPAVVTPAALELPPPPK